VLREMNATDGLYSVIYIGSYVCESCCERVVDVILEHGQMAHRGRARRRAGTCTDSRHQWGRIVHCREVLLDQSGDDGPNRSKWKNPVVVLAVLSSAHL